MSFVRPTKNHDCRRQVCHCNHDGVEIPEERKLVHFPQEKKLLECEACRTDKHEHNCLAEILRYQHQWQDVVPVHRMRNARQRNQQASFRPTPP